MSGGTQDKTTVVSRIVRCFDYPWWIAVALVLASGVIVAALHFFSPDPVSRWISTADGPVLLAQGLTEASAIMSAISGVIIVFFVSDRGEAFRAVRNKLGDLFAPSMTTLFALPVVVLAFSITAPLYPCTAFSFWLIAASVLLLIQTVGYDLYFVSLVSLLARREDGEKERQETNEKVRRGPS